MRLSFRSFLSRRNGAASIEDALGYDPFTFIQLNDPLHHLAYLFFGWALNEALDCAILLFSMRNKWNSIIYLSLATALVLQSAATIMSAIGYSNLRAVVDDFYAADFEYYWETAGVLLSMMARWGYFLATTRMVLAVFPGVKMVQIANGVITSLALAGSLWYLERSMNFYHMEHDAFLEFQEKHDAGLLKSETSEISSRFHDSHKISLAVEMITLTMFMLLTKIPFLVAIFKRLNVKSKEVIKTMLTTRSTARIFISCLWSVIEGVLTIMLGPQALTQAITLYSELFQVHTLSLIAFQGSGEIIKMYTLSSSKNTEKTHANQSAAALSSAAASAKRSQSTISAVISPV